MLYQGQFSAFNFKYNNWGTNPATTIGTSIIPGASNAEGSWTEIASSANISQDCYWVHFRVHAGNTDGFAKNHLLDFGIDPAGGTSYTSFFENLQVGDAPSVTNLGSKEFLFPIFIKAGSSVAIRVQGSEVTAGTLRVAAIFFGKPSNPLAVPVGSFSQTFGSITNSSGQTFTPGNASDGNWADLGAVTKPLWWFQLGYCLETATVTAEYTYLEVAWGDASNKHSMFTTMHGGTSRPTCGVHIQSQLLFCAAYNPVPTGSNIYIRGRCNNAPDTGYHATVVGIGG